MPSLSYTRRALDDLDRLADFLIAEHPASAVETGTLITQALEILEAHPLIGRPVALRSRELIISRGRSGYIALYEYEPSKDRVLVHAIRNQREAGFEE